jgi:predicted XRE-type DNA-binding protein
MAQISYDHHPDFFSALKRRSGGPGSSSIQHARQDMRDHIQEAPAFIIRYFQMLPLIDATIARLYYLEKLSQDQISDLLDITQAAVSRRLKFIMVRVKFLLKMPTLNPMQVRNDFEYLFPEELFEFAFFFYWEHAQNRVKYFIKTSQSGAANKFARVMVYLEEWVNRDEADLTDEEQDKKVMALTYYEYFQFTREKSHIITFLFKKSDPQRTRALVSGQSILTPEEAALVPAM